MQLLSGTPIAQVIKDDVKSAILAHIEKGKRSPTLAVILVGNHPASQIYVTRKKEACAYVGIQSLSYNLSDSVSESELLSLILKLNKNESVDGILVQLPLPKHINANTIIESISPHKDVDGFHPYNLGKLAQNHPNLQPCTPYGIMTLLEHYQVELAGLHTVVVGASNIVGRPLAIELLNAHCTVTICHSKTKALDQQVKNADLLVSATGKRHLIQNDWIKPNAIVIDVGIHRENNKVTGDLDFDGLKNKVKMITPVPGGVGPMTVAMLMKNTLQAYLSR